MNEYRPISSRAALTMLRSDVLRSDSKLEAAAMFDRDHVAPGAVGSHVTKIQLALNQLDHAYLALDGVYGPRTATAVVAYKSRRGIVDRSRQIPADASVDKRTILALDRELLDTRWHRRLHLHHHGS